MIKRLLLYILAGAILAAVAASADRGYKDTALLEQYAAEITAFLETQEASANSWVQQQQGRMQAVLDASAPANPNAWIAALSEQASAPYTILILQGDSIVFASNNKILPLREQLRNRPATGERNVQQLALGYYYIACSQFEGARTQVLLVPVRFTLGEANRLKTGVLFPANPAISEQVELGLAPEGQPVRVHGEDLCWLRSSGSVQAAWVQWFKLTAFGLLLFLVLTLALQGAMYWVKRGWAMAGAALLLALVGGIFWLNRATGFTAEAFNQLPIFAQRFDTPNLIGNSIGDWLIHLGLLLWLMIFFHRAFRADDLHKLPSMPIRLAISLVCYLLVMLSVLVGVEVYRQLVFHSTIIFDFDNLLNFDMLTVLAFGGIFLLLLALFLFGHRLMSTALQLKLPNAQRIAGIGGAALTMYLVSLGYQADIQVNALYIAAFALVYVAAFDFFLEQEIPGLGGIVLWLLLFSLSSALLLYRYNYLKDRDLRMSYAKVLVEDRDSLLAEPQLRAIAAEIRKDTQLNRLLKPWPFKPQGADLRKHFHEILFPQRYLFQHYRLVVYAFDKGGAVLPQDQARDQDFVVKQNWDRGQPLPDASDIRYHRAADGVFRYMLHVPALRMNDPSQSADIYCFFEHQYPQRTRVYSELFYHLPYKNLEHLTEYNFAVQKNGKLVVEQGQSNQPVFQKTLPAGKAQEQFTDEPRRVDAVYKSADGKTIAAVGRPLGGWHKQLYLFAFIFALTSLFIFALALLNTFLPFLPAYYQFNFSTKGSLAKRIHYGNFALIGLAFIGIGYLTYQHFSSSAQDAQRANMDNRANAVLTHLRNQVGDLAPASDTLKRTLPQALTSLAASLATDVNLFDPEGRLLFSSQNDLAQLGILPKTMNPRAEALLTVGGQREAVVSEQIAGVEYASRYLPLKNNQNQLLGFLGVPYHLSGRQIGVEVSDFIGMLASVYVFLMLITYVVSVLLSRSILRPVQLISNKIKQLQLANKNEPLKYPGGAQDELSALIDEYNNMVEKLEESKSQLIRLERESAWREMARQVAHDIKNPLTTMKLSMQQLERVSNEPAQAAAYLKKAITRLIEQIDSLAQIASEFSMFANLDIRQKHDLVLNDVVESVYDLFSEQKDVELSLNVPKIRFHIDGDKNHLIRVFNNLIINAIQAIPSDRRGEIRVSLFRQNNHAIVQINDNGGGIPPEIQKRVFEPNFTTKTSGSGLGLAICRKIIEALDGNIRFETRENDGTDFFVELPITSTDADGQ